MGSKGIVQDMRSQLMGNQKPRQRDKAIHYTWQLIAGTGKMSACHSQHIQPAKLSCQIQNISIRSVTIQTLLDNSCFMSLHILSQTGSIACDIFCFKTENCRNDSSRGGGVANPHFSSSKETIAVFDQGLCLLVAD